jgi:serine/threonine protein kinase
VILKQYKLRLSDKNARSKLLSLVKEVELVKGLNCVNITKYMVVHRSAKSVEDVVDYSIVMEYVDSGSLLDLAKSRRKRFSKNEIQDILGQVLNGVKHLHSHNIIHRDIKPINILVDKREARHRFKITDFSVATKVSEETPEAIRACAGTPWYMAPEVILGYPYSYAADI